MLKGKGLSALEKPKTESPKNFWKIFLLLF